MTFVTLILFELFFAHSCRSLRLTVLQLGLFSNPWLWLATLSSAAMTIGVLYIPSWARAFHTVPLGAADWGLALAVSGGGFVLVETGKWVLGRWTIPALGRAAQESPSEATATLDRRPA